MTDVYFSHFPTADKVPPVNIYIEDSVYLDNKTVQEIINEIKVKSESLKDKSGNEVIIKNSIAGNRIYLIAHSYTNPILFEDAYYKERKRQNEISRNLDSYNKIKEVLINSYLPPICIKIDLFTNTIMELESKKELYPNHDYQRGINFKQVKLDKLKSLLSSIEQLLVILPLANGEYDPELIQAIGSNPIWQFKENISAKKAIKIHERTDF